MSRNIYLFSKTENSEVNHVPVLLTEFLKPEINYDNYDAIVLTSKQAVIALENINHEWIKLPVLTIANFTANQAREAGATVLEHGTGYGDSLAEIIINGYPDKRWLYPRPVVVASDFAQKVQGAGVSMDGAVVYKTTCNSEVASLKLEDDAILIFTSPLTIECFLKQHEFKITQKVIAIGKTTATALPKEIDSLMPKETSVQGCVDLAKSLQL
ncbi:MAG: uroporphyrinogen-III synthase [Campylobacterota bacterium]|nr:uroporphyrinogen-III synthase [Campylobacterota bacterium]